MKKLITFCVFGDSPVYLEGLFKNLDLAKILYPDWISRIYVFKECEFLIPRINEYDQVEPILISKLGNYYSTLYRFLPLGEPGISYFISRDTDSRLSYREREAVDQWIFSGKKYHIMKDHPFHYTPEYPVLAGMWGALGGLVPDIQEQIINFINKENNYKGVDQKFLYHLYHKCIINDNLSHNSSFPSERNYDRDKIYFVGQAFDESNNFYGNWETDLKLLGL